MSGLDLYLSQRTLALLLVYGAVVGFGLGALYDGLRILRMTLGEPVGAGKRALPLTVLLLVEDVVFALAATVAFILLCYYVNDGQIRAPAALGLCGGFFVYRHTVSRLLLRVADRLICLVKHLLRRIAVTLLRWVTMPLRALWAVSAGRWLKMHRERATEKQIRELTEQAAHGFGLMEEKGNPPAALNRGGRDGH